MASYRFYTRLWQRRVGNNKPIVKILVIALVALLFFIALILAVVHIARQSSDKKEKKRHMDVEVSPLLQYFHLRDGIHIKWAHAVNSQKKLEEALKDDSILVLEADVIMDSVKSVPIMGHPPANTSDVTLESWMKQVVAKKGKGMKLDVKQLRALEPSLKIVKEFASKNTLPPLLLNADVLIGPNNPSANPLNGTEFIRLCMMYFKKATLSIGWTTRYSNAANKGYSWEMVKDMLALVKDVDQPITFPVRASLAYESREQLFWLLMRRKDFTLTIWTALDDIYDPLELKYFRKYPARVYFDLPESQLRHIYDP